MATFNSDLLNLIHSLKPFLGPTAKQACDLTDRVAGLLATPQGVEAYETFKLAWAEGEVDAATPDSCFNPFLLFLILVLLILAFNSPESSL